MVGDSGTLVICSKCGHGCTKGGTVVVYSNNYRRREEEVLRPLADAKTQAAQASRALALAARGRRRTKRSRYNGPQDTRCRSPPQERRP